MVGGIVAGKLSRRIRPAIPYLASFICLITGYLGLAFFHDSLGVVLAFAGLAGFGQGLSFSTKALLIFRAVPVDRQAQMAGTDGVIGGLAGAAMPILLYLVLNANTVPLGPVTGYSEAGLRGGFLLMAGTVILGLVVAVLLLLRRRPQEEAAAVASDLALRSAGMDKAELAALAADTPVPQVADAVLAADTPVPQVADAVLAADTPVPQVADAAGVNPTGTAMR